MFHLRVIEDGQEAQYVVNAEMELSRSNPYENPHPMADYFEPEEFVGPPTRQEHEMNEWYDEQVAIHF